MPISGSSQATQRSSAGASTNGRNCSQTEANATGVVSRGTAYQTPTAIAAMPIYEEKNIPHLFPLAGALHGYLQVFSGYGESMIDYNLRQTKAGLGVTIAGWR